MATLTVWKFNDATGARQALQLLERQQKAELIEIIDAAIVTWPEGRKKPKTEQLHNMTGAGALGGSFWGLLFGLLFFIPLLGMAMGAALGALSGSMADVGIDDSFIKNVRDEVTPGSSALFVMTGKVVADRVLDEFQHRRETGVDEPVGRTGSPSAGCFLRVHGNSREGLIPVRCSGPALLRRRRTRMRREMHRSSAGRPHVRTRRGVGSGRGFPRAPARGTAGTERLRAEVAALQAARPPTPRARRSVRWASVGSAVLLVLGLLLVRCQCSPSGRTTRSRTPSGSWPPSVRSSKTLRSRPRSPIASPRKYSPASTSSRSSTKPSTPWPRRASRRGSSIGCGT